MQSLGFEKFVSDPNLWVMVFIFAVPHVLYAYVWLGTKSYIEKCKEFKMHPCDVVAQLGVWIKIWQYFSVTTWYILNGPMFSFSHVSWITALISIVLIVTGQIFNFAVYNTLGKDGVYYGFKLGRPCPWVKGFPFVIRDPQYSGCVMTIWGCYLLLATAEHNAAGMFPLACAWTLCYLASSIIEGHF